MTRLHLSVIALLSGTVLASTALGAVPAKAADDENQVAKARLPRNAMEEVTGSAPDPVDQISQSAIQSAFQVLRKEYIRSSDLTFDELNRAALQGLLSRLDFGAELVRRDEVKEKADAPLSHEFLAPDVAYVRPAAFTLKEAAALEKVLQEDRAKAVTALILDLRTPAGPGAFEVAAAMLECFVPRGELMFKMKQLGREEAELMISSRDPAWTSPITILMDAETNNLGEAVAAVLHDRKSAILVGEQTRGATVRYETLPVDDTWVLRFARAEMLLPDDTSLFRMGLKPDFEVRLEAATKHQIFKLAHQDGLKAHLFDRSRTRYNEAALVARKNPELDAYIRRSAGEDDEEADHHPLRDVVAQRALDMILSREILSEEHLSWKQPAAAPKQADRSQPKEQIAPAPPVSPRPKSTTRKP